MGRIQWTVYTRIVFFFAMLLFLEGYLFSNLTAPLAGSCLLMFLYFCRLRFEKSIGSLQIQRTILENILYVDTPFHVKTTIFHTGGAARIKVKDIIPKTAMLLQGENTNVWKTQTQDELLLSYQAVFTSRGTHTFESTQIEITDFCHLFTQKQTISVRTAVHIHSNPKELKKAKTAYTQEDVLAMPSLIGSELTREFEGIRAYLPGDLIRDIDWKASSRLQTLLTKTFQKKELLESMILLDCTRSMRRTSGKHAKIEHAIVVGIQLTHLLQSMHHQVGFIAYDEHKIISHITSSFDYQRIYRELATLPTIILTDSYTPNNKRDSQESPALTLEDDTSDQQQFLSLIAPFISGTSVHIMHPLQTSGIYQAIKTITYTNKQKHIIILTDLETNRDSYDDALRFAHAAYHKIWLLTFSTPYYHLDSKDISTDLIEKIYTFEISQEQLRKKLIKKNIEIVEITPQIQAPHIMEYLRRKK